MKILQVGDPRLRVLASEVTDFGSHSLVNDIQLLKDAMRVSSGVGIAAPQLGIDRRLFLIESAPNPRYPNAEVFPLKVFINPQIVEQSSELSVYEEACLSVPEQRLCIKRPSSLNAEYMDEFGVICKIFLDGFPARVFLHELDHLNGVLIVDHVTANF
jgi:peptide deformylase